MKRNQLKDLRGKNKAELLELLKQARANVSSKRMNSAIRKERNIHAASAERKSVAQIFTILREKELEA